jgi:cold shock CspA family protein
MTSPQATVLSFDATTGTGSVVMDDGSVRPFSAAAFALGGLRLLRPGQRVRLDLDESGDVRALTIATLGEP